MLIKLRPGIFDVLLQILGMFVRNEGVFVTVDDQGRAPGVQPNFMTMEPKSLTVLPLKRNISFF